MRPLTTCTAFAVLPLCKTWWLLVRWRMETSVANTRNIIAWVGQKVRWVSNINLLYTSLWAVVILGHVMHVSKLTVVFNCATLHPPNLFVKDHLYTIGLLAKAYLGPSASTFFQK
jgi:hypothetical protein